jgi:protein-disulfide isomerase
MRLLLSLLALIGATFSLSLAGPAAAKDWTQTVVQLPSGAYRIGNPAAKVKLVEYLSYSCPHCAAFQKESAATLYGKFVASGSTSIEIRNQVHDQLDLAVAVLAQCAGAARFEPFMRDIYAKQDQWLGDGIEFQQANERRMAMYPPADRLKAAAQGAGISAIALQHGFTQAQVDACLTSDAPMARITAMMRAQPPAITGTPGFIINGTIADKVYTWEKLEPLLRSAGAH